MSSTETLVHDDDDDCALFHGIFYLGCASVNAPRSETEALKTIAILRSQNQQFLNGCHPDTDNKELQLSDASQQQIKVILSIPNRADGAVRLLEPKESNVIASFKLYTILLCISGRKNSLERDCFSLTESRQSSDFFQCHVFRCDIPEAVGKIMNNFQLAFRSIPKSRTENQQLNPSAGLLKRSTSSNDSTGAKQSLQNDSNSAFCFVVSLEIKEDDGKGTFGSVPWDKGSSCFKFRQNHEKQFNLTVAQSNNLELTIERCFGLLLSQGRHIRQSDMHLLELENPASDTVPVAGTPLNVTGMWDPSQPQFTMLNTETPKGSCVFFSVAVDLVIQEIQEPVRFLVETQACIYPQQAKFWTVGKKVVHENIRVQLKEVHNQTYSHTLYVVESIETEGSRLIYSSQQGEQTMNGSADETSQDNDEPLLSGSGAVSMECSEKVLSDWGEALSQWRNDLSRRPSSVRALICSGTGVPEALRGEVWQLLAGCFDNDDMLEKYRHLLAKDSPQENVIQRDIHRTFPAHDHFKTSGGDGQESLYRISKAYSIYDHEVGYCQGLSFLAAALLLHMPEEQAFCVLVQIMYGYKMRNLFKNGFEDLHLKFYQLERLMEDLIPNLHEHFKQLNVECHMFSSQWFLTLYTAKFPLNMVYHVLDIFLCEGETFVFNIALGLLECCRSELLTLDFEGVLKYFRVHLPKKYRDEDQVKQLTRTAVRSKITKKKLDRYQKEYQAMKEKMALEEDPVTRVGRENKLLMEANMRLELENDDIAQELVTTRITLTTQLERTMKHAEDLQRELQAAIEELRVARGKTVDLAEENNTLLTETKQVKEMCRRELARQEEEVTAKSKIISDYKGICTQLSERVESLQAQHQEAIESMKKTQTNGFHESANQAHDGVKEADGEMLKLQEQTRSLELELAQTKLKLVEAECKVQDVEHDLSTATKAMQASKNTWLQKTFSSLTNKKAEPVVDASAK